MALLEVNYRAASLDRNVTFMVVLPTDRFFPDSAPYKTLYLLHGLHGNYIDWITNSRIRRMAEDRGIAVVLPCGDNSFYVDQAAANNNYGTFVGQELVEITRRMFPLSHKREDTFIGGLSMGGFGALRNGLKYHDTFSAIVSLSGAVDILQTPVSAVQRTFGEAMFGPIEEAIKSDKNPRVLIENLKDAADKPRIYCACGTEDFLLPQNRTCRQLLEQAGFDLTYEEGPGGHTWDFWNTYIQKALDWLL